MKLTDIKSTLQYGIITSVIVLVPLFLGTVATTQYLYAKEQKTLKTWEYVLAWFSNIYPILGFIFPLIVRLFYKKMSTEDLLYIILSIVFTIGYAYNLYILTKSADVSKTESWYEIIGKVSNGIQWVSYILFLVVIGTLLLNWNHLDTFLHPYLLR